MAARLAGYRGRSDVTVLALPRGGVPVAAEVAGELGAPLDVFVVRKLGVPGHRELAMGALASGGVRVLNHEVIARAGVGSAALESVTREEAAELARRERAYRGDRPPAAVDGRVVVLVDDGLATGASMRAAVAAVRALQPTRLVVAVPVGAPDAVARVGEQADEVVCVREPWAFTSVGQHYVDFRETTDHEVRRLLDTD